MPSPRYYPAVVLDVIDGDTVRVFLDRGGDDWWRTVLRLAAGNARESKDPGGGAARTHLAELVAPITALTVRELFDSKRRGEVTSAGWDKYGGRIDGSLSVPGVGDVAARMIADGYMAAWNGVGTRPVPPWPLPATGGGQ
jgi:endonuclease YncB( thermonuclease family)